MIVNDLVDIVLGYQQLRDVIRFNLEDNEKYYLSDKHRLILKSELLERASISVKDNKVQLFENVGQQDIRGLTEEVKEGYWVYLYICSADYWDMIWYPDYESAKEAYRKEKLEYFLCEKVLFHTERGIIKVAY